MDTPETLVQPYLAHVMGTTLVTQDGVCSYQYG
jgi:hypothetical protein